MMKFKSRNFFKGIVATIGLDNSAKHLINNLKDFPYTTDLKELNAKKHLDVNIGSYRIHALNQTTDTLEEQRLLETKGCNLRTSTIVNGDIYIRDGYKISSVKIPDDHNVNNLENLLHNAYVEDPVNYLSRFKGDYTFVLWDEKLNKLKAVVSPFSSRCLFYTTINNALYIASDAQFLVKLLNLNISVNKKAVSKWLSGRPDPNTSMFNEINQIPQGSELTYDNGEITVRKFWGLNTKQSISYTNTKNYQEHFYSLLHSSVNNSMSNDDLNSPVFSQMSGGMDSTSITALANEIANDRNMSLHTLSHTYKNTESCDESMNIEHMIDKLKLNNAHFVELDKFYNSSFGELYPTDFDNPGIVLSPKYREELKLIQSLGANTLLTGNGGDEMCWGHSASYRSRLYKGELSVVSEVIEACKELNEPIAASLVNLFVKPIVPNTIMNLLRIAKGKPTQLHSDNQHPTWLTDEAIDYILQDTLTNPYSNTFEPAKHARYVGLHTTSTFNSMRSYQKLANEYDVNVKHPFFDTDIVQYSFAIPEKMLIQGSYPKWLLRKTMEEYLPESVVWNKHKVVFDHHFANLVKSNKTEIRKLLTHEGLQELGLINNEEVLAQFDRIVEHQNSQLNVDMLYVILTQSWFQTHFCSP